MLVVDSCPDTRKKMPFIRRKRNHSASVRNHQIEAQGLAWLCFAEDHSWFQGNILTDDESNYSLYGRKVCRAVKEQDEQEETKQQEVTTKLNQNGDQDNYYDEELDEKLEQLIIRTTTNNPNVVNGVNRSYGSSSCSTSSSCEELEAIEEELNNNHLPKGVKKNPGNPEVQKSPSSSSFSSSRSSSPPSSKVDEYYNVMLTDHFSGLRYELPKISVNNNREGENLFICADGQVNFLVENIFKGQKAEMMIQRHIDPTLLGKKCLVYHGPMTIVFNEIIDYGRSWCL